MPRFCDAAPPNFLLIRVSLKTRSYRCWVHALTPAWSQGDRDAVIAEESPRHPATGESVGSRPGGFRSVKPNSYPVPHDGPVGKMLRAQGRPPYRPAQIHFIVSAARYRPLVTAFYIADDRYLESDAVFGARVAGG
ncbi:MAG: hypothetical protein ACREQ4_08415 [Candidatus Binataceae bacterium]